jgi:hypothetical protein
MMWVVRATNFSAIFFAMVHRLDHVPCENIVPTSTMLKATYYKGLNAAQYVTYPYGMCPSCLQFHFAFVYCVYHRHRLLLARKEMANTVVKCDAKGATVLRMRGQVKSAAGPSKLRTEVRLIEDDSKLDEQTVDTNPGFVLPARLKESPAVTVTTPLSDAGTFITLESTEAFEDEDPVPLEVGDHSRKLSMLRTHSEFVKPILTSLGKPSSSFLSSSHAPRPTYTPQSLYSVGTDTDSIGSATPMADNVGQPVGLVCENSPVHALKSPLPSMIHNSGSPNRRPMSPFFGERGTVVTESPGTRIRSRFSGPNTSSPLRPVL